MPEYKKRHQRTKGPKTSADLCNGAKTKVQLDFAHEIRRKKGKGLFFSKKAQWGGARGGKVGFSDLWGVWQKPDFAVG
jgi:hypothetical protein